MQSVGQCRIEKHPTKRVGQRVYVAWLDQQCVDAVGHFELMGEQGVIQWRRGWMVSIRFDPLHQYCSAQILLVEHRGYEYTGGS